VSEIAATLPHHLNFFGAPYGHQRIVRDTRRHWSTTTGAIITTILNNYYELMKLFPPLIDIAAAVDYHRCCRCSLILLHYLSTLPAIIALVVPASIDNSKRQVKFLTPLYAQSLLSIAYTAIGFSFWALLFMELSASLAQPVRSKFSLEQKYRLFFWEICVLLRRFLFLGFR